MLGHLLALQVVIPLLSAPVIVLLRHATLAWGITTLVSWVAFICSCMILLQVMDGEVLTYQMGNWAPPMGIEYRVDGLNAFMLTLVTFVGAVTLPYAFASVRNEIDSKKHAQFYAMYLLCIAGLLGITITNDAFNLYVFLEVSSLATYSLIAMGRGGRALRAAFEYLILGSIGATFILIGIGFLYMMTGTLNISDLSVRIPEVASTTTVKAAFAFLTLGVAMKIALFPLHGWLCNAYSYAPSFISSFLSATATKVGIYVLIRFIFTLFGVSFVLKTVYLSSILVLLSALAIIVGSTLAIFQQDIKRMLAYSSVAQIGYMTLAVSFGSEAGIMAAIIYLFAHALAKSGLFLATGCVMYRKGGVSIKDFQGVGKEMPWTMAAFLLLGLSLIGLPFTVGFISKWYLLKAAFLEEMWMVIGLLLFSSLLAIVYFWRVIEVMYFAQNTAPVKEPPLLMRISVIIMALGTLLFGVMPAPLIDFAQNVSVMLLRGV